MRTAVCLSGNMRTFSHTHASLLRNIVEPNSCDVFIATWEILGNSKHNFATEAEFREPLDEADVRAAYGSSLKTLKIFNFDEVQRTLPEFFYRGMCSMFWMIQQGDILRREYEAQNGFKYDCVVRARPDALFHTGFALEDTSPLRGGICVKNFNATLIDDTFALGTPDAMAHYADLFLHIEEYFKFRDFLRAEHTNGQKGWPEQILRLHLERANIPLSLLPIEYEILRPKTGVFRE